MKTLAETIAEMNTSQLDNEARRAVDFAESVAGRIYLGAISAETDRLRCQFEGLRVTSNPAHAEQHAQNCGAIAALNQFADPAGRVRQAMDSIKEERRAAQ